MSKFYTPQEFKAQYEEYLAQGYTPARALKQVQINEQNDRMEYDAWLDSGRREDHHWDDQ